MSVPLIVAVIRVPIQAHSLIGLTLVSGVKSPIGTTTVFGISRCRGERMPRIVFRGKIYYSVFEMPPLIRQAYDKEQKKARSTETNSHAAPNAMKHLPSDESLYQPSPPIIDPVPSTIEPDQGIGMRGLAWGVIVALVISGIAFLLSRLLF